jgi:hypothetical protein
MLYLIFILGILLVILSFVAIFKINKAKDNPNYKQANIAAWICLLLGAVCVIVPRCVWKTEKPVSKTETKKEVIKLTLQDFSTTYTPAAKLYDAPAGFVLNIETGEKADVAKAKINDISSISIAIEKGSERKITGIMIFVGNSSDSDKMMEALKTTYAIVKIFEPDRTAESIPEFVQKILNMESGKSANSNNVIYTVNQALNNTILTIRYSTE